jgi:putative transposase
VGQYLPAGPVHHGGQIHEAARLNYIQPGKPQQNAYVKRFNRTVRYEWLSQYYRDDLAHVQQFATEWMWQYNHERPNMGLGGVTPKQRLMAAA